MQPLENKTPFVISHHIMPNEHGQDAVFVAVKASFRIGRSWTLAEEQMAPVEEDIYWGEPGQSSLQFASDLHLPKPGTDIVIHAHAQVPDRKPVRSLDVRARIADRERALTVWGDRVWQSGVISAPEPFESIPIRYEFAYGGRALDAAGQEISCVHNPVGMGFHPEGSAKALEGKRLPNIECPDQLIRQPDDQPQPAGFGFIAPYWEPRASQAGTYDDDWRKRRAPYVPRDYRPRFQNAAHPDWIYPGFLQGGEPVHLENLHPAGSLSFEVPLVNLGGRVNFSGRPEQPLEFDLTTLVIDVDRQTLFVSWQAVCLCNNDVHRLRSLSVGLKR